MEKIIILTGLALLMFLFSWRMKISYSKSEETKRTAKRTTAKIDRVIFSDTGNVKYYVYFYENEKKILAQTEHYTSDNKSLNSGDQVEISYYYTKEGKPRAVICFPQMIPCADSTVNFYKGIAIIGGVLLLVALAMLVLLLLG